MSMRIVRIDHERRYPPRVTQFTSVFWENLSKGVFSSTRCAACRRLSFPPKPICPHCWGDEVVWEVLPSTGSLYSWTRIHAAPAAFVSDLPYVVGVIDTDAGIRLGCALVDCTGGWSCDMRIDLVTLAYTDGPLLGARADVADTLD